ncbi:hypothetical protein X848_gp36 [Edwardsiella phage PEi21]|uniref:Uncharacterized protein n=1 Tax=Edwardsiella phage PEi21 TaxID=1325372 RepID=N0DP72_9CAUD|nr:hypothetical protein X848_gp36 [Edwardsiella phage PEi21]BAN16846.1 hypothetical protein [Edwardsiella phage PEi21]
MITIIDENNIVTENGVELVAEEGYLWCGECYFSPLNADGCSLTDGLCIRAYRDDDRDVIFVEKNPC